MGAVAQLGEHLLCKQGVTGSIPVRSMSRVRGDGSLALGSSTHEGWECRLRRG